MKMNQKAKQFAQQEVIGCVSWYELFSWSTETKKIYQLTKPEAVYFSDVMIKSTKHEHFSPLI